MGMGRQICTSKGHIKPLEEENQPSGQSGTVLGQLTSTTSFHSDMVQALKLPIHLIGSCLLRPQACSRHCLILVRSLAR